MITKNQLEKFPLIHSVFEYVNENYIIFLNTYKFIMKYFDDNYLSSSEELLSLLRRKCSSEENFINSIKRFIRFSHEYLLLQVRLEKDGKYLCSSFEEVNKNVYQKGKVMNGFYLDGLWLSQVLWPNHYRMGQYFLSQQALTTPSSSILEVPSGAGIYTYYLARHFKYKTLKSIDISRYSKAFAEKVLKHAGLYKTNISLEIEDVYNIEDQQKFDFIVCGELLEHVENPRSLLNKLSVLLKDDGRIFLTTAIYTAERDHIYLFYNVAEVKKFLEDYFEIISELPLPVSLKDYNLEMDRVPINYTCMLRKKNVSV